MRRTFDTQRNAGAFMDMVSGAGFDQTTKRYDF
jgi:hypothetical protein